MTSMNELVREYTLQPSKNMIQKAYRGIMSFMADLRLEFINDMMRLLKELTPDALFTA